MTMLLEEFTKDLAKLWKRAAQKGLDGPLVMFGTLAFAVGGLKACGMSKESMLQAASRAWDDSV